MLFGQTVKISGGDYAPTLDIGVIEVDTSSAPSTIYLPNVFASTAVANNYKLVVVDVSSNASSNPITIVCSNGQKVNGSTSISLNNNGVTAGFIPFGVQYWIGNYDSGNSSPSTPSIVQVGAGTLSAVRIASSNIGSGNYSTVFGFGNNVVGDYSNASGGSANSVCSSHSTVSGGYSHLINVLSEYSTISGGYGNLIEKQAGAIGGGCLNQVRGTLSSISGGYQNIARSDYGSIGGGYFNQIGDTSPNSTISGGSTNCIVGEGSTISGGYQNYINTVTFAKIGGGKQNTISGYGTFATISGGYQNTISGYGTFATISGGYQNIASSLYSTISGGYVNTVSGTYSVIGGGDTNIISGTRGAISGGSGNCILSSYASIGGGYQNTIQFIASNATISGGIINNVSNINGTISGGYGNTVSGASSTVSGGYANTVSGYGSYIGGGYLNTVSSLYSVIGGGACNTASAYYSGVTNGTKAKSSRWGQRTFTATAFANTVGSAQFSELVLSVQTSKEYPTEMFLNASASERITIASGYAMYATINIGAIKTDGAKGANYIRKVGIKNVGGTTSLVGAVSTIGTDVEDNPNYDVSITADDTNDSLKVVVTGDAGETLRWVAYVSAVEIKM